MNNRGRKMSNKFGHNDMRLQMFNKYLIKSLQRVYNNREFRDNDEVMNQ